MNVRSIFRTLSIKNAYSVLWEINNLCETEEYPTFNFLVEKTGIKKNALRRITNRLSRSGLIKSVKANTKDKRQRVFIICDKDLNDLLYRIVEYIGK